MKNHTLLFLVSSFLTVASVAAASTQNPENLVSFPAYQVLVSRQTEAEQAVTRSLNEFSLQASKPMPVRIHASLPGQAPELERHTPQLASRLTATLVADKS